MPYYYLVSSLPLLRHDGELPMSHEAFLTLCREQLSEHDCKLIEAASLNALEKIQVSKNRFLHSWLSFRDQVLGELTEQRARKLELPLDRYRNTENKETRIIDMVRSAVNAPDPLQGELLLMQLYWNYLEELSGLDIFVIETLMAYAIKLQILERKNRFTREEGNGEFDRLFSNLQFTIQQTKEY